MDGGMVDEATDIGELFAFDPGCACNLIFTFDILGHLTDCLAVKSEDCWIFSQGPHPLRVVL